jgi:hypothetical protein
MATNPTRRSSIRSSYNATVNVTVTAPADVAPGDWLMVILYDTNSSGTTAWTPPTGWSKLVEPVVTGTRTGAVYVHRRDASEGSYVFTRPTTGATTWVCVALTGGDWATPNAFLNRATSGSSLQSKGLSLTPTVDQALVIGIALEATTAAEASEPTVSSNFAYWGGITQAGSDTNTLNTIRLYYQQQTTKTASGDMVVTYPNGQASNGAGVLVYVRPIADAVKPTVRITTATEGVVEGYLSVMESDGNGGLKRTEAASIQAMPFGRKVNELMTQGRTFVMAHRGGSLDYREMSMRAYTQAVSLGCTGLEFSVARASTGEFFGLHDAELNRTSPTQLGVIANGATPYLPGDHTWDQIKVLDIEVGNADARFGNSKYMLLADMADTYAKSHTIFIDPKVVGSANIPPLITYLQTFNDYANTFVGKYFHTGVNEVANRFRNAGMKTWGYYYADDLYTSVIAAGGTPKATSIRETNTAWDFLGLSWDASQAAWDEVLSYGKPVIGHIVPNAAAAATAFSKGASGVMASGIRSVMSTRVS